MNTKDNPATCACRIWTLSNLIQDETQKRFQAFYGPGMEAQTENDSRVNVIPGIKYTKIDVGGAGKLMVENATSNIYGIKSYGVIHRGKHYGNLDTIYDYYWGDYRPRLKNLNETIESVVSK